MKREFLQSLKIGDAELPKEIIDAIMAENGKDIQQAKTAAQEWEEKYNRAVEAHQQERSEMAFQNTLQAAVSAAKGRNVKAISALLDTQTLKASEDPRTAIDQALVALKDECGYLFEQDAPPPYAKGTGTHTGEQHTFPATLAGALKEKYERK